MIAAAFATWLEGESLGPAFVEHLPESPDVCAAVLTQTGPAPESRLGSEIAAIQVVVRGASASPVPAYERAQAIYNGLHNLEPSNWDTDADILLITANHTPAHIGRDAKGRHEYSLNFLVRVWNPERNL